MGGWGSGRWTRWGTRPTQDQFHRLAMKDLTRGGWLQPGRRGTIRWFRGDIETGSIGWLVSGVDHEPVAITLTYQCGGESVGERIELTWTECHFGGKRPWFVCYGCGRRCGVLYGSARFRCRRCHGLTYESTRESKECRAIRRAQAIRQRLGGDANLYALFPPKPLRMHWNTYWRLWQQADAAEEESLMGLKRWRDRMQRYGDPATRWVGEPDTPA